MNATRIMTAGLALVASVAWPGGLGAQVPPEIVIDAGRDAQVAFASGCAVRYDAQGRRTGSRSGCSSEELNQADIAYADYRRGQEGSGSDNAAASGRAAPRILAGSDRGAEVDLGDGCSVRYEPGGGRTHYASACSSEQLTRSDFAYASYRQERGWDGPRTGVGAGGGLPPQIIDRTNRAEVVFGDNCVVTYAADGRRTRSTSACSGDQLARADNAMANHLREREMEGEAGDATTETARAPAPSMPEVVVSNGFGRVAFPGGCTVTYNDLGRRTESTRPCSAEEVRLADAAVEARRSSRAP